MKPNENSIKIIRRADRFAYILAIGNTIALIFVDHDFSVEPFNTGPGVIFGMIQMYADMWFPMAGLILFAFYFFFEAQRIALIRSIPSIPRKLILSYIILFACYFLFQNPLLIYELSHNSLGNAKISIKIFEFVFIILLPIIVERLQVKLSANIKQIS